MGRTFRGHTTTKRHSGRRIKRSPLFIFSIGLIAILGLIVLGWWGYGALVSAHNQARLERIEAIYASLQLDPNDYAITLYDVFGEKRPYDYDKSRSQASHIQYVHAHTVSATAADLDAKIKAAGFSLIDEPYPGSSFKEYHYKSTKGEYVRLNVMSKPYFDATRNDAIMNKSLGEGIDTGSLDTDAAPTNVSIKVNLDDNNE